MMDSFYICPINYKKNTIKEMKLIYYFKSCEVSPTVDEEDRLWNNIMSEISASRRRRRYELNRWRISLISLGVAAMLSGIVWILQDNNRNELHSLYVAYQAMDVSTHIKSDKVKILTGEKELIIQNLMRNLF